MKSCVLEVPSGFDITDILETFMHTFQLGLIVMGGRGYVTNVNPRKLVTIRLIVDQTRVFEIVSVTEAFAHDAHTQGGTGLKFGLTDARDNYVREIVGSLMVYDEVHVIVGVFMEINSEEFNVQPMQPLGIFLPPAAMATQQHFQTPTMITVQQHVGIQSIMLVTLQQQVGIQSPSNRGIVGRTTNAGVPTTIA
jgi:hypothetical protein